MEMWFRVVVDGEILLNIPERMLRDRANGRGSADAFDLFGGNVGGRVGLGDRLVAGKRVASIRVEVYEAPAAPVCTCETDGYCQACR